MFLLLKKDIGVSCNEVKGEMDGDGDKCKRMFKGMY
jgi:hypothetical protein